jgi:DNA-binding beta-propeller fold protein YncE
MPVAPASGEPPERRPVFLGVDAQDEVLLLDPATQVISRCKAVPADVNPTYAYPEAGEGRLWFSNDGDEDTGNDPLHCGSQGSPVTVVETAQATLLKTLCVGRGHHVTAFAQPSANHPKLPRRAFVSNLLDGTISVVGNDRNDISAFLSVIATINLLELDKEKDQTANVPNHAFPHGMVFSPITGRIYSLNNGYGTVAVIDPRTNTIENRITLSGCSNLLLSPNGRYVVAKGADRKANAEHVLGKVAVIDTARCAVVTELMLKDFYPSTFRFSPDGRKLYVTSAATGKGLQKDNLDISTLRVFDATQLPSLTELTSIKVGRADCGRRPLAFAGDARHHSFTFVPNPTDGTLTILDAPSDAVLDTVAIGPGGCQEVLFSFWNGDVSGC